MTEPSFIIKICLLGEAAVGKTSLVYRFVTSSFKENYKATLGVNLLKKDLSFENHGLVSNQIWDLGGQESFQSLRKLYLDGANGALVIFDVTNQASFEKLDEWIGSFIQVRGEKPMILIGNKVDLKDNIKISESQVKEYASQHNMTYLLTSAKSGENVEEAFEQLINTILDDMFST